MGLFPSDTFLSSTFESPLRTNEGINGPLGCPWVEFLWSELLRELRTLRGMGFNKQTDLKASPDWHATALNF
jgi:hypothetical protein